MNDLISVIVPIYGVEDYLEKCVNSIISQTYHNLEIILVDDGSQDKCPEMCDAFVKRDNRIRVIHKKMVDYLMQEMSVLILQMVSILFLLIVMTGLKTQW